MCVVALNSLRVLCRVYVEQRLQNIILWQRKYFWEIYGLTALIFLVGLTSEWHRQVVETLLVMPLQIQEGKITYVLWSANISLNSKEININIITVRSLE
jgi:hypothetical protein